MILPGLCFYLFAAVMVASAVMVIAARNPVHSVLFLILAFLNASGLFVLMGAEFLAMVLAIVYVGAVAVLFLFVVMMLDIDLLRAREGFLQYLPIGALVGVVLLVEVGFVVGAWQVSGAHGGVAAVVAPTGPVSAATGTTNTRALGEVLFTQYFYLFQAAGVVLLIAMVGAIVLTLRQREGVRRQSIPEQTARTREDSIEVRNVTTGSGV